MSNNLKLQIILAAADKLTAPMRNAMRGAKDLASALGKTKDEVKSLERVQNQLARFNNMRMDGSNLNKSIDEQNKKIQERLEKLSGLGSESRRLRGLIKAEEKNLNAWVLTSKTLGTKSGKRASSNYREEFLHHAEQAEKSRMHLASLNMELDKVVKETRKYGHETNMAKKEIGKLEEKKRGLAERLRETKRLLKENGVNTRQLSSEELRLSSSLNTTNSRLEAQRAQMEKINEVQKRLAVSRAAYNKTKDLQARMAGRGAGLIAGGTAVGATAIKPIIEFAKAENASTALKVSMMGAGGVVRKEFGAINELANRLGNRLPGTTSELQDMMSVLIQQGMTAKAILGGVGEATAYLAVQMKLPYEQAALFSAKLQDATGTAEKDMMSLMDVIQRTYYLGVDNDNMLQAFAKLSPALSVLRKRGLEASKALAPLIVMADQSGMAGEASGNAFRKVFQMSMDAYKVGKANSEDLTGTGIKLNFSDGKGEFAGLDHLFSELAKMRKLTTEKRLAALKTIFGDDAETLQVLTIMIEKGKSGYEDVQKKMEAQADIQRRVNAQLGTLSNLWDAATGTFTNALVKFGESVSPEVKAITEWIGRLSERLGRWSDQHPELSAGIMKTVAAASALMIGMGGLSLALAAILGPMALAKFSLSTLGIKILPDLGAALTGTGGSLKEFARLLQSTKAGGLGAEWAATKNAIAGSESPLVKMRGHIKRNRGGLYQLIDAYVATKQVMSKSLSGVMSGVASVKNNPLQSLIKGAGSAGKAFWWLASSPIRALIGAGSWLGSTVLWLGRLFLLNPVGLFVTAVAAGAMLIFKYWEPVKAFIGGVIDGFSAAIEPIKGLFTPLKPIFTAIGDALKWVFDLFSDLLTPVKSTSAELSGAAEMGRKFGEWLAEGVNIAMAPLKLLIDGIKWVLDNLPGLDKKINIPENFKPGAAAPWMQPVTAGGPNFMATMTPVTAAKSTVVHAPVNAPITIVQQPGQNDKDLAAKVKKHVEDLQRKNSKQSLNSMNDRD